MGAVNVMVNLLGLEEPPNRSHGSISAARKLMECIPTDIKIDEISLKDLWKVVIDVENHIREVSQNTDLDIQGFDEALLQRIEGSGKRTAINDQI